MDGLEVEGWATDMHATSCRDDVTYSHAAKCDEIAIACVYQMRLMEGGVPARHFLMLANKVTGAVVGLARWLRLSNTLVNGRPG